MLVCFGYGNFGRDGFAFEGWSTVRGGASVVEGGASLGFDSHGKARFRNLDSGLYMVSYGNRSRMTDIAGRSVSCGYARLIAEDREYLAWLELSAEDKLKAIEEGEPIARWAASVQARRSR